MKNLTMKKRILMAAIIIIAIFASYSSYSITDKSGSMIRVKKFEELQNQSSNYHRVAQYNDTSVVSQEIVNDQAYEDKNTFLLLFIASKKILILFYLLSIILSIHLFCRYLRDWLILISQLTTKLFLVHYLQLKDGKKNAPSFCYSL